MNWRRHSARASKAGESRGNFEGGYKRFATVPSDPQGRIGVSHIGRMRDDDYDVLAEGVVLGPDHEGRPPWMWTSPTGTTGMHTPRTAMQPRARR
jgi:hypothetical protein